MCVHVCVRNGTVTFWTWERVGVSIAHVLGTCVQLLSNDSLTHMTMSLDVQIEAFHYNKRYPHQQIERIRKQRGPTIRFSTNHCIVIIEGEGFTHNSRLSTLRDSYTTTITCFPLQVGVRVSQTVYLLRGPILPRNGAGSRDRSRLGTSSRQKSSRPLLSPLWVSQRW